MGDALNKGCYKNTDMSLENEWCEKSVGHSLKKYIKEKQKTACYSDILNI
jgi:hypothetical protein